MTRSKKCFRDTKMCGIFLVKCALYRCKMVLPVYRAPVSVIQICFFRCIKKKNPPSYKWMYEENDCIAVKWFHNVSLYGAFI